MTWYAAECFALYPFTAWNLAQISWNTDSATQFQHEKYYFERNFYRILLQRLLWKRLICMSTMNQRKSKQFPALLFHASTILFDEYSRQASGTNRRACATTAFREKIWKHDTAFFLSKALLWHKWIPIFYRLALVSGSIVLCTNVSSCH